MTKVVVITGGSPGIGLCAARALLEKGCRVYELSRRALQKRVAPIYTLGGKYKLFVFLTRLLPMRLMTYIVGTIYAS